MPSGKKKTASPKRASSKRASPKRASPKRKSPVRPKVMKKGDPATMRWMAYLRSKKKTSGTRKTSSKVKKTSPRRHNRMH